MRLIDSKWSYSATDLANFLRCGHRITLDRAHRLGDRDGPSGATSPHTDLLARRGGEHERDYVEKLRNEGRLVTEISSPKAATFEEQQAETLQAMRRGDDVIVQGFLANQRWYGYADLLFRVDTPSNLGSWSYEVGDTKLATSTHPHVLLQLSIYTLLLEEIQGTLPKQMRVILGDQSPEILLTKDFSAYLRRVRGRLIESVESEPSTEAYPVDFCGLCKWNRDCYLDLVHSDHLSLVANIRRDQVKQLRANGIATLSDLARAVPTNPGIEIPPPTLETLHHQARLQRSAIDSGTHSFELLDPEERRGLQLLPRPSDGDLFFDVEADPFENLVYLFGLELKPTHTFLTSPERYGEHDRKFTEHPNYIPFWAHDQEEERLAFERLIDFIVQTRLDHPDAHVYHYGPTDPSALKKLMGKYATRENELDDLLREEVFVDLLRVVRQGIRISHPSYSLKKVESFYTSRSFEGVIDAGGAIVAYENWRASPEDERLLEIEEYNREDCESTLLLQGWLLQHRTQLEQDYGIELSWAEDGEREKTSEEKEAEKVAGDELTSALHAALPDDPSEFSDEQRALWILGHLLHYHRRDEKPGHWERFERAKQTPEQLVDDRESIGLLELTDEESLDNDARRYTFSFPPQQHKLSEGTSLADPESLDPKGYPQTTGDVVVVDDENSLITIRRRKGLVARPLPRAVIPNDIITTTPIQDALRRFAADVLENAISQTSYPATRDILLRNPPRITGHPVGSPLQESHLSVDEVINFAGRLEASALFIQGPPGSGKTYRGAKIILELIRSGLRVGVCARSHKAIDNLLHKVEREAEKEHTSFLGLRKSKGGERYQSPSGVPRCIYDWETPAKEMPDGKKRKIHDPPVRLIGGTQWCFCPSRKKDGSLSQQVEVDVLVIDEAGQMSLADALAVSMAAKSVILLGDPLQLAQVSQGTHPDGCGTSVLEHLLGDDPTIPAERGIFLVKSLRMNPNVRGFISEVVYDGRLKSADECAQNELRYSSVLSVDRIEFPRSGLAFIPSNHEGSSQESAEEAEKIAEIARQLIANASVTTYDWSEERPRTRPVTEREMLVVTPYNAQVRRIRRTLESAGLPNVRVGTVDKFQGQEAPVVLYSMATSSGEDIPRSLDFLFSLNRLNVAISRAQCLAILVASPKLLDVDCKTIEQMKLVNSLCRFVELATNHAP